MLIYGPAILGTIVALLLCFAALHDLATRTVPNWVAATILGCGVGMQLLNGQIIASLLVGFAVLVVTFIFWCCRWLGGADVKLLAATCVAVPLALSGSLLLTTAIAGGFVAVFYLAMARMIRRPAPGPRATLVQRFLKAEAWRMHRRAPLPYAAAIATGALFTLVAG